jgi:vacuolar-type H+-ATPase subunit H
MVPLEEIINELKSREADDDEIINQILGENRI